MVLVSVSMTMSVAHGNIAYLTVCLYFYHIVVIVTVIIVLAYLFVVFTCVSYAEARNR